MSQDQRYEYQTLKVEWGRFEDDAEEEFNELARDGWKLIESAALSGSTTYYIFERPVE
jgi:hypothetical protein